MVAVQPAAWLSWNGARLLALIFNAFAGLLGYYDHLIDRGEMTADTVLALRIIQGHINDLDMMLTSKMGAHHPGVSAALRNISERAGLLAALGVSKLGGKSKFGHLLERPQLIDTNRHKILNEAHRWPFKELKERGGAAELESQNFNEWLASSTNESNEGQSGGDDNFLLGMQFQRCVSELLGEEDEGGNGEDCNRRKGSRRPKNHTPTSTQSDCLSLLLDPKGTIGYTPVRQVLLLHLAAMAEKCAALRLDDYFTSKNSTAEEYAAERCTNIFDETTIYRREKRRLVRVVSPSSIHLLMEQLFVCGSLGYVEFANPHLLITVLAWQHPQLGCITREKPEPVPSFSLQHEGQSDRSDTCLLVVSTAVSLGLLVFVRFLLDPGPWSEHHYADQLVHVDFSVVAEEKFAHFDYLKWVRDANIPHDAEPEFANAHLLPRPPPSSWSPDLIAFVLLLLVFVAGSVVAHNLCSGGGNSRIRRVKQFYPYAFKKL